MHERSNELNNRAKQNLTQSKYMWGMSVETTNS